MYLDNPKKLFDDLYAIPTMYHFMVACAEDGMSEDLTNLISIVKHHHDELHDGGEGSCAWDLDQCETEKEREQLYKDHSRINRIWKVIQKELRSKYVICCGCGMTSFLSRRLKYDIKDYYCGKCKNKILSLYTFEEWLVGENIYNDIKQYLKGGKQ